MNPDRYVHPVVCIGAAWMWRLLVIFAGLAALALVFGKLKPVVIPVGLALLASALLAPLVDWLHRHGVPRAIGVVLGLLVSIGVVAGILTFVVEQFVVGLPGLTEQITTSVSSVQNWLTDGPFHFSQQQIDNAGNSVVQAIKSHQETLTTGALATAGIIGEIVTGALLMLFTLIFFLYGGRQIWEFVTRLAPKAARPRIRVAGTEAFRSLVGYVRATVVVAAADAVGIGAGLAILQVPLALPLASLVFIGAFIPIVGAVVTGFVAVLVALVTKGFVTALIALAVVIGVMQLEGHVLQPLLLGRAVRVHPLAVVLSIATGIVLAGIIGGLLAVPIVAMANTAVRSLLGHEPDPIPDHRAEPDDPDSSESPSSKSAAGEPGDDPS